jgi:hypothetical protein
MANKLGANLQPPTMKNWFEQQPTSGENVYIVCDPFHMLKLLRNALGDKKLFCDVNGGVIQWEYIVHLHKLQVEEGLHAASKLHEPHKEWQQMKMKVKLAAQPFSSSVADALDFCDKDLKLAKLKNVSLHPTE